MPVAYHGQRAILSVRAHYFRMIITHSHCTTVVPCTVNGPHTVPHTTRCVVCRVLYLHRACPIPVKRKQLQISRVHLCNAAISWDIASYVYLHITIHKIVDSTKPHKKVSSYITRCCSLATRRENTSKV